MIFGRFGAPKCGPKPPQNQSGQPLAWSWYRFGAAKPNLGPFWLAWARFFVDLDMIWFIFERV